MANNYNDDIQKIQACLSCKLKDCKMYSDKCRVKQLVYERIRRKNEKEWEKNK